MRSNRVIILVLIMTVFISSFAVQGSAANTTIKEFTYGEYKMVIPNYIELKKIDYVDKDGKVEEKKVILIETPEKDSSGNYPIFEVVTTDNKASSIQSYPKVLGLGDVGYFEGDFVDGRLVYSPKFSISEKEISEDKIFVFDFEVYDKDSEMIFKLYNVHFMFVNPSEASNPIQQQTIEKALPTSSKVIVNGKQVAFEAYNINNNNYFKLRDIAMALNGTDKQFQVGWDSKNNAISITTGQTYTPVGTEFTFSQKLIEKEAKSTSSKIYVNGKEVQFVAYNIDGSNYFKLRDLGKIIDFAVTWDGKLNMVGIDTTKGYIE